MKFSTETDPRARIWKQPEEARFDELLAVLLSSGLQGRNVLQISQELADLAGSERGLLHLNPETIASIKGIGRARAAVIVAAIELARRQNSCHLPKARRISERELADRLKMRLYGLDREYFYLFSFNRRLGLIREHLIARGGMASVEVSFRELLKILLNDRAFSTLIAHNHPDQSARPGREDLRNIKQLTQLFSTVGIRLIDQYIVGTDGVFSCRKRHFIERESRPQKELISHFRKREQITGSVSHCWRKEEPVAKKKQQKAQKISKSS